MDGSLDVGNIFSLRFYCFFPRFWIDFGGQVGPLLEVFVCFFSIQVAMPFCHILGIDFGDFLHLSKWPPYGKYQYFVALGYLCIDTFFHAFLGRC